MGGTARGDEVEPAVAVHVPPGRRQAVVVAGDAALSRDVDPVGVAVVAQQAVGHLAGAGGVIQAVQETMAPDVVWPSMEACLQSALTDLVAMRRREGLTQKELSQKADIPQGHISAMERGKMKIGTARAKKLGKALNEGYKVFL